MAQLRALDWDTDGPFQAYPLVLVRHPSNPEEGHAHAVVRCRPVLCAVALPRLGLSNCRTERIPWQVGYPGDVGAITGYSSAGVAISEKVWLHYKGSYTFEGAPTTYVLRELLQVRSHKT